MGKNRKPKSTEKWLNCWCELWVSLLSTHSLSLQLHQPHGVWRSVWTLDMRLYSVILYAVIFSIQGNVITVSLKHHHSNLVKHAAASPEIFRLLNSHYTVTAWPCAKLPPLSGSEQVNTHRVSSHSTAEGGAVSQLFTHSNGEQNLMNACTLTKHFV